jgi:hypothetical protein
MKLCLEIGTDMIEAICSVGNIVQLHKYLRELESW